jgi:hypothetical protein
VLLVASELPRVASFAQTRLHKNDVAKISTIFSESFHKEVLASTVFAQRCPAFRLMESAE